MIDEKLAQLVAIRLRLLGIADRAGDLGQHLAALFGSGAGRVAAMADAGHHAEQRLVGVECDLGGGLLRRARCAEQRANHRGPHVSEATTQHNPPAGQKRG